MAHNSYATSTCGLPNMYVQPQPSGLWLSGLGAHIRQTTHIHGITTYNMYIHINGVSASMITCIMYIRTCICTHVCTI